MTDMNIRQLAEQLQEDEAFHRENGMYFLTQAELSAAAYSLAHTVLDELLPERRQAAEILRERAREEATRAAGADDEGEYEIATHFRYAARVLREVADRFDARVGVEPQKESGT